MIEPFNFEQEYGRSFASTVEIPEQMPVLARCVALEALIQMKEIVARPQDLVDVQHLRWIL